MLIGSTNKLSKPALLLLASVASTWLHNTDIFYFSTKSWDWIFWLMLGSRWIFIVTGRPELDTGIQEYPNGEEGSFCCLCW